MKNHALSTTLRDGGAAPGGLPAASRIGTRRATGTKGIAAAPHAAHQARPGTLDSFIEQAQWLVDQVSSEMQEYYEERSRAWQESERGVDFEERLAAVQEVLQQVEELTAGSEKSPPNP